jgi:hypothetical protein
MSFHISKYVDIAESFTRRENEEFHKISNEREVLSP